MRDECTHCGTPKSDDYVCCAWAENDALRARLAEAERAVRLLMDEVIASGNGQARDFGWKPAIEAGRAVLRAARSMENRVMADDIVKRLLDEHFEQVRREGEEDADDRAALARDALARIQHLETYAEECRRAYELSEAKFREAGKLVDRLRAALASVVKHWREFGPEHGFDETLERAALAGGAERKPSRSVQRRIAVQKGEPMPTFGGGAEPASASPTMDQGPWTVFRDDVSGYPIGIGSDDFKRDVLLRVDGDFGCATEKADYCGWLANVLNGAANCKHCSHCGQWHNLSLGC